MLTFPLKELTHVTRPDASNDKSFPSGHTSHAFAAATFMAKELKDKSIWYGVGAYTIATGVGVLRIMNNRHWVSDVMAGAGIGILSTNIAYLTHQNRWGKNKNLTIIPTYSQGPGIYLCYSFK
jgi:membrane-associated phospholipid phosphatase